MDKGDEGVDASPPDSRAEGDAQPNQQLRDQLSVQGVGVDRSRFGSVSVFTQQHIRWVRREQVEPSTEDLESAVTSVFAKKEASFIDKDICLRCERSVTVMLLARDT